jgi:hypothetical protein
LEAAGIEPAAGGFRRKRSNSVELRSPRTSRHGTSRQLRRRVLGMRGSGALASSIEEAALPAASVLIGLAEHTPVFFAIEPGLQDTGQFPIGR